MMQGLLLALTVVVGEERWAEEPVVIEADVQDSQVTSTFDGERFWLAWQDERFGKTLHLSRAEKDGTVVGTATPLASLPMEARFHNVVLAAGADTVLIAWIANPENAFSSRGWRVYAAILDRDGDIVRPETDLGPVDLGDDYYASAPRVVTAAGHGGFVVAWPNDDAGVGCSAQFVSEDGALGTRHRIGADIPDFPRDNCALWTLAATTDGWLAVTSSARGDLETDPVHPAALLRLAPDATQVEIERIDDLGLLPAVLAPPLAFDLRAGQLSAWRLADPPSPLWSTPLMDEDDERVFMSLAASSEGILVARGHTGGAFFHSPTELVVDAFTSDGLALGTSLIQRYEREEGYTASARPHRVDDGWILTYYDNELAPTYRGRAMMRRLALDGAPVGPPINAARRAADQDYPIVAAGGGGWLVLWRDEREQFTLRATIVDERGVPRAPSFLVATSVDEGAATAEWGDDGWLVVWRQDLGDTLGPLPLWARRVAADGTPGQAVEVGLTEHYGTQRRASLAWDGSRFLVLSEPPDAMGATCMRLSALDREGRLIEEQPIIDEHVSFSALACGTAGCLAAWGTSAWTGVKCGVTMEAQGHAQILGDVRKIDLVPDTFNGPRIMDIAVGPDGWLVVFDEKSLEAVHIDAQGRMGPRLALEDGWFTNAEATWTGDTWLIASSRNLWGTDLGREHVLWTLDPAATRVEDRTILAPGDYGQWDGVGLGAGEPGRALVAYPRWDSRNGAFAERITLRLIETGATDDAATDAGCGCRAGTRAESPAAALLLLVALAPLARRRR